MMKSIVVFKSKYGSTEKYAKWIGEALNCPAKSLADVRAGELDQFDAILYGGGLYAGTISGFKKFISLLGRAEGKKLALFMVGMTNPVQAEVYEQIADKNIPAEWKGKFEVFALRGDQLFSRMSFIHKIMMRLPKAMAEKKPVEERTEDDKHFIESFGRDTYFSSMEQIEPIVNYLRKALQG